MLSLWESSLYPGGWSYPFGLGALPLGSFAFRAIHGSVGIESGATLGVTGALVNPTPEYSVFIGGVDRTADLLKARRAPISRNLEMDRATARFTLYQKPSAYRPTINQDVQLYKGVTKIFGGVIQSTREEFYKGMDAMELQIRCIDYSSILWNTNVTVWYGGGNPAHSFVAIVLYDMYTRFLADSAVTLAWNHIFTTNIGERMFTNSFAEALNQLLDSVGGGWRVDFDGGLHTFPLDTGYKAAPVSFADDDDQLYSVEVEKDFSKFVNRQGVRNSQNLSSMQVDESVGDGVTIFFPTTYFLESKPVVRVNSVEKIVIEFSEIGSTAYDFYYTQNATGVVHNPSQPRLTGSDAVEVEYPSPFPTVVWAEDAASIAAYGKFESVEEVKDVPDPDALQVLADGLLAQRKQIPTVVTLTTPVDGLEPGQLLTMNLTQPLVSGTFLIESVSSKSVPGSGLMIHKVRASSPPLRNISASLFFARLLERSRQAVDRVTERITFVVAGTIEGLTNPGLTTGVKSAFKTATRNGYLKEVRLHFGSVAAGTPTTSDIEIDVFQNGVSIFGTTKMEFPAGATAEQVQRIFANTPQAVLKKDRFTFEVLQADSAAKDGVLELVYTGIFG